MSANDQPTANLFDSLNPQSMRMLVRIYLFEGAPYGPTVTGLFQFWRQRSRWQRSDGSSQTNAAGLTQRFLHAGLCAVDGSLPLLQ